MKTTYKCEICDSTSENQDAIYACEGMCKLANQLDEIFGSDDWNPALPIIQFKNWNRADRKEMAKRIDGFYTKHFK